MYITTFLFTYIVSIFRRVLYPIRVPILKKINKSEYTTKPLKLATTVFKGDK